MADPSELTREIAPELPPNGEDHEPAPQTIDIAVYPIGGKILIRRDAEKEMIGSIVVAEASREKQVVGTVLAVGPGAVADGLFRQGQFILIPPRVPVGARVLFGRFAGADVPEEFGAGLVMCREDELLAILR